MDWYEPYSLAESVRSIRKFLIGLAGLDRQLRLQGLAAAQILEDFEKTIASLDEFPEKFAAIKRKIFLLDEELFLQLDLLEKDARLVEQLSLINLKIQMACQSRMQTAPGPIFGDFFLVLARAFVRIENKPIFEGENISLEKAIVGCDRLISTLKIAEGMLRYREESDDAFFKPSNVKQARVAELLDKAADVIEEMTSISPDAKSKLIGYLQEAKAECASDQPQWTKIIGALVIAAAITSGLADAPEAAKTLKSAIEYILGTSVPQPLHRYLPKPEQPDGSNDAPNWNQA